MNVTPTGTHPGHIPPSVFEGTVAKELVVSLQSLIDEFGWTGVNETLQEMNDVALLQYMGTDAQRWAAQFVRLYPNGTDEGTLISWFANAIEAGKDVYR